jgi:hypothetical protein
MQSTLKFRGVYIDGRPDYTVDVPIEHTTAQQVSAAKGQLFQMFAQMGGIAVDQPDGVTVLHPTHLFSQYTIEVSTITLASKIIQ